MQTISLPVAELRTALAGLGKVIPKRITLAVLGQVRVRRHDSGLIDLTVTDLDRFATYSMNHRGQAEPASLLVPFGDLNNIAKSCGGTDVIELEPVGKNAISIRFPVGGQSAEHHCESAPPEEFPLQPEVQGTSIAIDEALRSSIHEALECASTDPTRLVLNGAFIDVRDDSAHYVVGTDGRHLFSSNSFSLPLKESILIPEHKFLGWKGFQQDGEWKLRAMPAKDDGPPCFEIASDHWRFQSQSIDSQFPQWKTVLPNPASYQTTISINPEAVDEVMVAVQRLPLGDDKHHTIGLDVADNAFRLLGRSRPELPWTKIDIQEAGANGPDATIFLDRRTLLKALRFGLTRIEIIDSMSPLRFSLAGRQMIIMPLRMNGDTNAATTPPPAETALTPNTNPPPQAEQRTPPPMQTNTPPLGQNRTAGANGSSTPSAQTTTSKEEAKSSLEAALVQIEAIKTGFRETINGLTKLGDHIRQSMREQKASEKEIQTVRQTLRSLQGVRI